MTSLQIQLYLNADSDSLSGKLSYSETRSKAFEVPGASLAVEARLAFSPSLG